MTVYDVWGEMTQFIPPPKCSYNVDILTRGVIFIDKTITEFPFEHGGLQGCTCPEGWLCPALEHCHQDSPGATSLSSNC